MVEWKIKEFNELTTHELYEMIKLRIDVFVVEQECPYPELDDKDKKKVSDTYSGIREMSWLHTPDHYLMVLAIKKSVSGVSL